MSGNHSKNTIHVGFFVHKDLVVKLDVLAADDNRSRSGYLRLLIERHVKTTRVPRGNKPGLPVGPQHE